MGAHSNYSSDLTFTPRESDILRRLSAEQSHEQIMADLHVQPTTLLNYISQIRVKIAEQTGCVYGRNELATWARQHGYNETAEEQGYAK